jgi:hypothetical protein
MDTASGLTSHLTAALERRGALRLLLALLLVLTSFAVTVTVAALFQPVPEMIVAAPFRW